MNIKRFIKKKYTFILIVVIFFIFILAPKSQRYDIYKKFENYLKTMDSNDIDNIIIYKNVENYSEIKEYRSRDDINMINEMLKGANIVKPQHPSFSDSLYMRLTMNKQTISAFLGILENEETVYIYYRGNTSTTYESRKLYDHLLTLIK